MMYFLDRYLKKVQEEEEAFEKTGTKERFVSNVKEPSLAFCLVKIFAGKFLAGAFLKLIQDRMRFCLFKLNYSLIKIYIF